VTNMVGGSAEWLYETMYCARGQMENFIKLHKTQLHSDRTSCRSPLANQVRLVLHTAAYFDKIIFLSGGGLAGFGERTAVLCDRLTLPIDKGIPCRINGTSRTSGGWGAT